MTTETDNIHRVTRRIRRDLSTLLEHRKVLRDVIKDLPPEDIYTLLTVGRVGAERIKNVRAG